MTKRIVFVILAIVLTGLVLSVPAQNLTFTPTPISFPSDSDGDGFSDDYETRWGSDSQNPQSVPMALDLDGDGLVTIKDAIILYRNRIGAIPVVPLYIEASPSPSPPPISFTFFLPIPLFISLPLCRFPSNPVSIGLSN